MGSPPLSPASRLLRASVSFRYTDVVTQSLNREDRTPGVKSPLMNRGIKGILSCTTGASSTMLLVKYILVRIHAMSSRLYASISACARGTYSSNMNVHVVHVVIPSTIFAACSTPVRFRERCIRRFSKRLWKVLKKILRN